MIYMSISRIAVKGLMSGDVEYSAAMDGMLRAAIADSARASFCEPPVPSTVAPIQAAAMPSSRKHGILGANAARFIWLGFEETLMRTKYPLLIIVAAIVLSPGVAPLPSRQ
jgi:hypothetical protein